MDMQSALAAGQDVLSITAATPPVLTYAGTDTYANGDFVLLSNITQMVQVNERVFRVANVVGGSDTLELEGEVGVGYTAQTVTVTGTAANGILEITFGTSIQIVTGVTVTGGEPEQIDGTTIHDTVRNILYGVFTPVEFSMDVLWDPSDLGLIAMKAASQAKAKRAFRITFPDGKKYLFYGRIAALGAPTGTAQGLVTSSAKISQIGVGTFYAT